MQREELENEPFLRHRSAAKEVRREWPDDTGGKEKKEAKTKGPQCEGELLDSSISSSLSTSAKLRLLIFTHKISPT